MAQNCNLSILSYATKGMQIQQMFSCWAPLAAFALATCFNKTQTLRNPKAAERLSEEITW